MSERVQPDTQGGSVGWSCKEERVGPLDNALVIFDGSQQRHCELLPAGTARQQGFERIQLSRIDAAPENIEIELVYETLVGSSGEVAEIASEDGQFSFIDGGRDCHAAQDHSRVGSCKIGYWNQYSDRNGQTENEPSIHNEEPQQSM